MKEKVRDFIMKGLKLRELENDTNYFENGSTNSLFSMQLIIFLEEEFDITIPNEKMSLQYFCSVNNIMEFLEEYKN